MKKYALKPVCRTLSSEFENTLNPAQKAAVFFDRGPLLLIAGAGSGKTKTIVCRMARLIDHGVNPDQILLLTFTRKSAMEMIARANQLLDHKSDEIMGGTFHSFANLVLRQYASYIGFKSQFTIMDQGDSENLIQLIKKELNLGTHKQLFPKKRTISDWISYSKNTCLPLENIILQQAPVHRQFVTDVCQIARIYDDKKKEMHLMDYDDLILNLVHLLENNSEVQHSIHRQYEYVMVDEYQDTNIIQDRMIQAIVNPNQNIMVVGDDSQSIYSFRGANYQNIMSFPTRYPNAKVVTLTENYRSTQPILDLTNAIISQASKKFSKTLTSTRSSTIKPVHVSTRNENDQSRFICQKLIEICDEFQINVSDIAVLMRSGWHSNHLELELSSRSIPFKKYGGAKFIETSHIKDVIAFFRLFYNPRDQLSWQRVLLLCPGLGISNASRIINDIQNAVNTSSDFPLHHYAKKSYVSSLSTIINCIFSYIDGCSLNTIYDRVLAVYQPIFQRIYDDFIVRQADLDGFSVLIERFDNLEHLLSEMSLDPPSTHATPDADHDTLTLSTIHSAKGLEWHTVFILSCIDGFIPSFKSVDDQDQLEEERRLLYVALTRAKVNLFILNPKSVRSMQVKYTGVQFPIESRFLKDCLKTKTLLDEWCTEMLSEQLPDPTIDPLSYMNLDDTDSTHIESAQSAQIDRRRYYF